MRTTGRKSVIEAFLSAITDGNYRRFLYFLLRYGRSARFTKRDVSIGPFRLTVADLPSFIFQYKDIFVEEYYRFSPTSEAPVIYDCGANIGVGVLYFSHMYPTSRIVALEADPSIAVILQSNIDRNKLKNVSVVPKAVWIHNNGVSFLSDKADGGAVKKDPDKQTKSIPSIRLFDLLQREDKIDLMKMDIEGSEIDVITDCRTLLNKVRRLYIEYHAWKGEEQKLGYLLEVLAAAGFKYYLHPVKKIITPLEHTAQVTEEDLQFHVFAIRTTS